MTPITREEYDKYVYHFTTKETALEHILPKKQIRLSSFQKTNDPKESKDWHFSLSHDIEAPQTEELTNYLREIMQKGAIQIKEKCKVLCVSRDIYINEEQHDLNYSRGYAKPRMWAQYGGNYTGVCLVFEKTDLDKEIFNISKKNSMEYFSGNVNYSHTNFPLDALHLNISTFTDGKAINRQALFETIEKKVATHSDFYFFHKHEDWSTECEARWILRGVDADPQLIDITSSLKAVILGSDFNLAYLPLVMSAAQELEIPVLILGWMNERIHLLPAPNV